MKTTIIFKLNAETELPQDFIDAVPSSGAADESVDFLLQTYEIECSERDAAAYLKSTGGWSEDELLDHETNLGRLIWIATLNCQEEQTTFFYMGA